MTTLDPLGGGALFDTEAYKEEGLPRSLRERFVVPPFSVLNTRSGDWQDRRRAWVGLGMKSEEGRPGAQTFTMPADYMNKIRGKADAGYAQMSQVSIFDPVLCEISYRWFCPPGGQIIDPFAGGSVRGIVASLLGYRYWGSDLRAIQIDANREQASDICPEDHQPVWVCGDSMDTYADAPDGDFLFSCPPYGDLEVYSDDPDDLSAMSPDEFDGAYAEIIRRWSTRLRDDRFAVFVVGDYRDKKGHYRNFVGKTVEAFEAAGLRLYNINILVNVVGSLPVRVPQQFNASRKVGKCHQDVLTFVKGDWREAARIMRENTAGGDE